MIPHTMYKTIGQPISEHPSWTQERFNKRFYSTMDAQVLINDMIVTEISTIGWTIKEEVLPIYGYHSYTFDAMAHGVRAITGQLTVNFVCPEYLLYIIDHTSQTAQSAASTATTSTTNSTNTAKNSTGIQNNANANSATSSSQSTNASSTNLSTNNLSPYADTTFNEFTKFAPKYSMPFTISVQHGFDKRITDTLPCTYLYDCHITNVTTAYTANNTPLYEVYSFVAQDTAFVR